MTHPRALSLFVGLLGVALLAGCDEYSCTAELRYAVSLEVLDAEGRPVMPDEIVFSVDGGDPVTLTCPSLGSELGHCEERVVSLGPEREGRYEILVRAAGREASAETVVQADRCHVLPEHVTVILPE